MEHTIGFIGGGNMAAALVSGLARTLDPARIHVLDRHPEKLERLARETDCQVHDAPGAWITRCTLVVLAVKPQTMREALTPVRALLAPGGAALSIAAGLPVATLEAWLGGYPVLRAMPNTPAMVGAGVTGLFVPDTAPAGAEEAARLVLESVGEVIVAKTEAEIDLVGAIPGSGPAYVFRFMEALARSGEARGLSSEDAARLALGTVYGAALLAKHSGEPFASLRERVTSKGGTTAKALEVMNARGIDAMMDEAVEAALKRTAELATLYR